MVFSLVLHTNDLTRNGGLFVSSFLECFLDRSELKQTLHGMRLTNSQTTMTIRNRGLRTDRHQDSKEDRTRWEPVLTDKALAEAMAAKAEIRRETTHLDLALRTLQRARSASTSITTKNPRPAQ